MENLQKILASLPSKHQPWLDGGKKSFTSDIDPDAARRAIENGLAKKPLVWPRRKIIFITDPHADPHAFIASLIASGSVQATGDGITDFKLTGRAAEILPLLI